mmetsp:Transcript_30935/g.81263  ORF Transcript_30935/g.81263 Transcript_30935/m.81263 type:complete len:209 (-) Transcript_30935:40-666(-)
MPALHAGVDHAAVRHGIRLAALLLHLAPDLEHLLEVAGLAVRLHEDAQGNRRRRYIQLAHPGKGGLKAVQVLEAAACVEERIEKHLVHVLGLSVDEAFHQGDTAVDPCRVDLAPAVAHGLHQHAGDCVLVRGRALVLHLLESGPGLVDALAPHEILQPVGWAARLVVRSAAGSVAPAATGRGGNAGDGPAHVGPGLALLASAATAHVD